MLPFIVYVLALINVMILNYHIHSRNDGDDDYIYIYKEPSWIRGFVLGSFSVYLFFEDSTNHAKLRPSADLRNFPLIARYTPTMF